MYLGIHITVMIIQYAMRPCIYLIPILGDLSIHSPNVLDGVFINDNTYSSFIMDRITNGISDVSKEDNSNVNKSSTHDTFQE